MSAAAKTRKDIISDFTNGKIGSQMVLFALPLMASNALQVFYNLVDMIIVGRFVGSYALSAVSQGSMIIGFTMMICISFASGCQAMIAQFIGIGRREELNSLIGTLFTSISVLGIIITVLLLTMSRSLLNLINVPPESYEMAADYLVICSWGMIFTCGYNTVATVLRGMGDSRHPFYFILLSSVLNLILDLVFVGLFGFGVAGAAAATVLGQAVSFLLALRVLYRRRQDFHFDFKPASFRINKPFLMKIIQLGLPLTIQVSVISTSMLVVNGYVNELGVIASATFGVGIRLDDICTKITQAAQQAAAPMVGQNIAAGKTDRVKSAVFWTWIITGSITILFVAMYVLFGRTMFSLFSNDHRVLDMSSTFISAVLWGVPAIALMRGTGGFLHGIGHTKLLMGLSLLDSLSRIVMSILFGIIAGFGFYGFVLGFSLAPYCVALPAVVYFFSGRWKKRRLFINS